MSEGTGAGASQIYDREKRVLLTRQQEARLEETLRRLERATGGFRYTGGELMRSLLTLVWAVEEHLMNEARSTAHLMRKHPPTADKQRKDALEVQLAYLVALAVRRAPPPDGPG
jgi:hypothetical protein